MFNGRKQVNTANLNHVLTNVEFSRNIHPRVEIRKPNYQDRIHWKSRFLYRQHLHQSVVASNIKNWWTCDFQSTEWCNYIKRKTELCHSVTFYLPFSWLIGGASSHDQLWLYLMLNIDLWPLNCRFAYTTIQPTTYISYGITSQMIHILILWITSRNKFYFYEIFDGIEDGCS